MIFIQLANILNISIILMMIIVFFNNSSAKKSKLLYRKYLNKPLYHVLVSYIILFNIHYTYICIDLFR